MTMIKSLWASVQNDATLMRRLNGWLTIFWIGMIPVSFWMGWLDSVTYVSALSLWALVSGHWSAWQAARVEVKQQHEIEQAASRDLPGEIVERLVDETTVDETGSDETRGDETGFDGTGASTGIGGRPTASRGTGDPTLRAMAAPSASSATSSHVCPHCGAAA